MGGTIVDRDLLGALGEGPWAYRGGRGGIISPPAILLQAFVQYNYQQKLARS